MVRSPIRYPGGKSRHTAKILMYLKPNEPSYCEPFVGGGSVYLASGFENAWINDIDYGVYDLWRLIKEDPDHLINLIDEHTPILEHRNDKKRVKRAISLWQEVKNDVNHKIYSAGYRFLFLVKTCFSGVVTGGPTGGMNQNGQYYITDRWSQHSTIKRIKKASSILQTCKITNLSWEEVLVQADRDTSFFLDPPYLKKGSQCYKHSFDIDDHKRLAEMVTSGKFNYVVTVDDCAELRHVWSQCGVPENRMISEQWLYSMTASRKRNPIGKELFIVCDEAYNLRELRNKALVSVGLCEC